MFQRNFREDDKMPRKALVIDNDFFFVEYIAEILEDRGIAVSKAYDGKEGLTRLRGETFDFILLDIMMPKIDGLRFIRFFREKYPVSGTVLIAVSACVLEQLEDIRKAGADFCIPKGPMDSMTEHLNHAMDVIEKSPLPPPEGDDLFDPGKIYQRQATAELAEMLKEQQSLTESLGIGIALLDKDARIININRRCLLLTGTRLHEVLNEPVICLFPQEEKEKILSELKRIGRTRKLMGIRTSSVKGSPNIRVVVSVYEMDGIPAGWVLSVDDTDI